MNTQLGTRSHLVIYQFRIYEVFPAEADDGDGSSQEREVEDIKTFLVIFRDGKTRTEQEIYLSLQQCFPSLFNNGNDVRIKDVIQLHTAIQKALMDADRYLVIPLPDSGEQETK